MKNTQPIDLQKRTNESGFTLIEALMAVMIFSVGILATVSMQTASINANRLAKDTSQGAAMASSLVADVRGFDYNAPLMAGNAGGQNHYLPSNGMYSKLYHVRRIFDEEKVFNGKAAIVTITMQWLEGTRQKEMNFVYYKMDELK